MSNIDNSKEQKIDLSEIFLKYKYHWWWFAISLVVCISLGLLYIHIKRPVYIVTAKVLVTTDEGGGMGTSLMKNLSFMGQGSQVDDEIEILGAHSTIVQAIKDLNLNQTYTEKTGFMKKKVFFHDSPIKISAPQEVLDTLSYGLKFTVNVHEDGKADISVKKGFFTTLFEGSDITLPASVNTHGYGIYSVDTTKFYVKGKSTDIKCTITPINSMAENMGEKISLYPTTKKANSVMLTTETADIKQTKALLDQMILLYNKRGVETKNEVAEKTKYFINDRLTILYGELSKSENNIEEYKKSNNFVSLESEAQYQMTKKGTLETSLLAAETEYSILMMTKDFLSQPSNDYSLIPFSTKSVDGINEYNSLILAYIKLKNNAKNDNVMLQSLVHQIDAMRENVMKSINTTIKSLDIKLTDLRKNSSVAINRLGAMPKKEREFIDMQRSQSIQNYLYSYLLQKREENELVLAAAIPKGQIIDEAYAMSEPVAPKKSLILFGAFLAGLFFPIFILYIRDLFKTYFVSSEELSKLTQVPILGEICHSKSGASIVVKEGKTTAIVELFRLIRNNIQFMLPPQGDKVILVTSSVSGEGKSFISSNIASSLSLLGKKVVIVGMDIRSPQLANNFELQNTHGLTNYLSSASIQVKDIVKPTGYSNLDVIVAGPIPPNPSELLLSPKLAELIDELKKSHDYIILDSAPIALVSDTFSLAKYAQLTVYVTRARFTKRQLIKYFNKIVSNNQLPNPAIILNDADSKLSHGYGYGYGNKNEE